MSEERKDPKALLSDAIKKRDELNTFIKILQEMMGEAEATGASPNSSHKPAETLPAGEIADPMSVVYPGLFFGKSQPQAAKLLLERVKRPLKTRVIVECLEKGGLKIGGKKPAVNLWGVLHRDSDFILVPKAGWGLVDWYEPSVIAKYRKEDCKESDENNGEGNRNE